MPPVELGLDVGRYIDVVDDETLEVATEEAVAPVAVDDLETGDLAISDLEAGKVTQVDTGITELVTSGVLGSHPSSLPSPARPRHVRQTWSACIGPLSR